jgi:hypothetical protein
MSWPLFFNNDSDLSFNSVFLPFGEDGREKDSNVIRLSIVFWRLPKCMFCNMNIKNSQLRKNQPAFRPAAINKAAD